MDIQQETREKPKHDPNLIDRKEYRKRNKEFLAKHAEEMYWIAKLPAINEISWGSVLEEKAKELPDNIALKFEDIQLTYKEFNEQVNKYANYFISVGLEKSDVVEILMMNRTELLIIFSAIAKVGAINSMINFELRKKTLVYSINLTPGKFLIIGEECFEKFNEVKSELDLSGSQKLYFVPDQNSMPVPDEFEELPNLVTNSSSDNPSTTSNVRTRDPIAYIFTSGTTGLPKAAILVHYRMAGYGYIFGGLVAEFTPEDVMYICLPFFHGTALMTGWSAALATGAAVAVGRRFSASKFWDDVRKHGATGFSYVGEICRYLMNQPPSPDDLKNNVRAIIGNGLRPEIWKGFKERFNIEKIGEFYGASEGNGGFTNLLNFDCTVGTTTVVYALVKYDIENNSPIRNEKGFMEKVKVGETGLLLLKSEGPGGTFIGYTDKKATEAKLYHNVLKEGDVWFNTGDLLRDQGYKHAQFVDRLGDTFRWKGHNVSTTEVEEVLNVFDQVSMACVYGIQIHHTDGRAGMATIVPTVNVEDFDLKALAEKFRENLPDYAIPLFLRFKSEILVTSTFKFKKEVLKKESFNIEINDKFYIMLPGESEYTLLTKNIHENILNDKYKF